MASISLGAKSFEAVQRVHDSVGRLKVLYVTGNIDRLLDVRELAWEGEAFLDKPFTAKGLLEAVSMLLFGHLRGLHANDTA